MSNAMIEKARRLRADQSDAERKFWARVRDRRLGGLKFKRQVPIGPYFADFCCEEARLVVELDGGQHGDDDALAHDAARDAYLRREGLKSFGSGTAISAAIPPPRSIMFLIRRKCGLKCCEGGERPSPEIAKGDFGLSQGRGKGPLPLSLGRGRNRAAVLGEGRFTSPLGEVGICQSKFRVRGSCYFSRRSGEDSVYGLCSGVRALNSRADPSPARAEGRSLASIGAPAPIDPKGEARGSSPLPRERSKPRPSRRSSPPHPEGERSERREGRGGLDLLRMRAVLGEGRFTSPLEEVKIRVSEF